MNHKLGKLAAAALSACLLTTQAVQAVEFGAFGNVNLEKGEGSSTSFVLGGLDLFARQDISDKSSALVEYVIESGDGTSFVLDLERLVVDYEFNRALTLSAGRIHTNAGYWNTAYHHGQFLQPTISRPSFIQFEDAEGALSTAHQIGLFADGEMSSAAGVFKYHAGWSNNPQIDTGIALAADREILLTMSGDPDSGKTLTGKISFEPDRTPVQVGVYYQDGSYNNLAGTTLFDQTLVVFDLHANMGNFDFLTEYYNYTNDDILGATGSHDATAYFVQLAYTFAETWTPVVRFETTDLEITDPFADGTYLSRTAGDKVIAALRYDLDESSALTLEFSNNSPDVGVETQKVAAQWSFMMF